MKTDLKTPIWQLTVGEFIDIINSTVNTVPITNQSNDLDKNEYGLNGLAKILGCSKQHASRLKRTGMFDDAITQNGRKIIVDREKALQLFKSKY